MQGVQEMISPLADRIRPETIDQVVGQEHLIGEGKILSKILAHTRHLSALSCENAAIRHF